MNWPTKKIGVVCDLAKSGVDFFDGKKEYIDTGSLINGSIINFETVTYEKRPSRANMMTTAGDILVAKMKDTLKVYLATEEDEKKRIFSTGFFVFRPKTNLIISKYLFLYFISPSFQDLKNKISHGATQRSINNQDLEKYFEITIPPIGEQRRSVKRIEGLFAKIDEAQKLREESKKSVSALLQSALNEIFSGPKAKRWEIKKISDKTILTISSGGTPTRSNHNFYIGDIIWLKSGELNDNENIIDSEEHITNEALKRSSAKIFPKNTVLFAMYGATAGKLGILGVPAATNQAVAGMICKEKVLYYRFLYYNLLHIRDRIIANAWGGAQPNLSQAIIKNFEILLPSITEQKKIVAYLDSFSEKVQELQDLQQKTADDFKNLKKSILSQSFSGKLIK